MFFVISIKASSPIYFSLRLYRIFGFITGTVLELYGHNFGVALSIPVGLFENSLSKWLIVKGFTFSKKV